MKTENPLSVVPATRNSPGWWGRGCLRNEAWVVAPQSPVPDPIAFLLSVLDPSLHAPQIRTVGHGLYLGCLWHQARYFLAHCSPVLLCPQNIFLGGQAFPFVKAPSSATSTLYEVFHPLTSSRGAMPGRQMHMTSSRRCPPPPLNDPFVYAPLSVGATTTVYEVFYPF